ncbi:MAG: tetratricopeptide repeat protein [bacterium]
MKNFSRISIIASCSLVIVLMGIYPSAAEEIKPAYNLKVNNDSFTDFTASEDNQYVTKLLKIYFESIDINNLKFNNNEIITYKKIQEIKKDLAKGVDTKLFDQSNKIDSSITTKRIFDINLINERNNQSPEITSTKSNNAKNITNKTNDNTETNSKFWQLAEEASNYERIGNYGEAVRCYQNAIKLNPNRIELLYSYSLCLYKAEQYNNAEITLNKIIFLDNNFTLAHYNLGNIYFKLDQYNKALNSFMIALKQNPYSVDTCFNLALTLECLKENTLAEKYYIKCLEINPNDNQAQAAIKRLKATK